MDHIITTQMTQALQLSALDHGVETAIRAQFSYDTNDPYAVTLTVATSTGSLTWHFARELLDKGQYSPIGDGSVHVWPCLGSRGESVVIIELYQGAECQLFQVPTRELHQFLGATLRAIPRGQESLHLNVDNWIEELLL